MLKAIYKLNATFQEHFHVRRGEKWGRAYAKRVGACDPLELELRTVVRQPTRVLWKSRK